MVQSTWLEIEELRETIAEVRGLTDKPFGVNFVLSLTEAQGHANLDAALELGVPVVSTFWADPAPVIARIHDAGALSFHTVGSAEEARRVVDLGVDAVVAQGVEAGGGCNHRTGLFDAVLIKDNHLAIAGASSQMEPAQAVTKARQFLSEMSSRDGHLKEMIVEVEE